MGFLFLAKSKNSKKPGIPGIEIEIGKSRKMPRENPEILGIGIGILKPRKNPEKVPKNLEWKIPEIPKSPESGFFRGMGYPGKKQTLV